MKRVFLIFRYVVFVVFCCVHSKCGCKGTQKSARTQHARAKIYAKLRMNSYFLRIVDSLFHLRVQNYARSFFRCASDDLLRCAPPSHTNQTRRKLWVCLSARGLRKSMFGTTLPAVPPVRSHKPSGFSIHAEQLKLGSFGGPGLTL